jgi:CrcB protein
MTSFVVFIGAGLGGVARYSLGGWIQQHTGAAFPWATLLINISGSLALAFAIALLEATNASPQWRAFLGIGFLGGYTTFSTFSYETIRLLQDAQWTRAAAYILASVIVCLAGALSGFQAAAIVLRRG